MPSWTYNMVQFIGTEEKISKVKEKFGNEFDFNKIIPMPESLNIISPSDDAAFVYALCLTEEEKQKDPLYHKFIELFGADALTDSDDNWKLKHAKTFIEEHKDTDKEIPEDISFNFNMNMTDISKAYDTIGKRRSLGKIYLSNILEHGCPDWYSWANRYWGTKWNASNIGCYEEEFGLDNRYIKITYTFDTAWCMPYGIAEHMLYEFEDVLIIWAFIGEDPYGDNQGWWIIPPGEDRGYTEFYLYDANEIDKWVYYNWSEIEELIYEREDVLSLLELYMSNNDSAHCNSIDSDSEIDAVDEFIFI